MFTAHLLLVPLSYNAVCDDITENAYREIEAVSFSQMNDYACIKTV